MSRLLAVICVVVLGLVSAALFLYAKAKQSAPVEKFGSGLDSKPDYLQWAVGFEGDFTSEDTADSAKNCVGRMYVNALQEPRALRRETACGERKRIYIWRQDGFEAVLDPDAKVYWKPHTERRLMALDSGPHRNYVGRETLNGRLVDHYKQEKKQADGSTVVTDFWEDLRLHSTVRSTTPTWTYELSHVKEGGQPESLFTIPAGFREIEPPKQQ